MNGRQLRNNMNESRLFEEQLFETKQALFAATSVKQIKFLQQKIKYLNQKMKESKRR